MNIFGWTVAVALALQAPPQPAPPQTGTGVIHGRVVRVGGIDAIEDAQVFLNRGTTVAVSAGGPNRVGTAASDKEGNFEFRDLAPGRYTVVAQRKGYSGPAISSPDPSVSVVVSNAQTADAVIAMTPTGVIRGRVRDASGQFASNIPVDALVVSYRNGLPYLMPAISKATDDRGEYRLYGIPPGEYYIGATPRLPSAIVAMAGGKRGTKTFYPDAVDITGATPITIHGGEDISNIDIGIQTLQTFKVSGTVSTTVAPTPAPADARGAFAVIAQNQNSTINMLLVSRELNKPDDPGNGGANVSVPLSGAGPFELPNVLPGSYDLLAMVGDNAGVPSIARTIVEVRNQDVSGLVLTIRLGFQVRGQLTIDGKPPTAASVRRVALEPADTLRRMGVDIPANVESNGLLSFPPTPEGRFGVAVSGLLPDLYVDDVRQGSTSIFDSGFEIRGRPPEPIEVFIKSGAASLEGTVQDASGKLSIGGVVALVPITRRENRALYYTATADSTGSFTIRGIAPGDYKLFSWDIMAPGAVYNAAFLEKYEEKGIQMSFAAGARLTSKVTTIPR